MGPLAEAASSLQRGRVQSEKPTAGLLSGSHFHVAGVGLGHGPPHAGEGVFQCTAVNILIRRERKKERKKGKKAISNIIKLRHTKVMIKEMIKQEKSRNINIIVGCFHSM